MALKKQSKPQINSNPVPEQPAKNIFMSVYAVGFVAAAILFGVSAVLVRTHMHYMGWEISVFHTLNDLPGNLRPAFLVATVGPEAIEIGLVAVVVAFILKKYVLAWRLSLLTFGSYAVGFLVKHFMGRERPVEILSQAHIRIHETGSGFISGHTMMMTIVMLAILPYIPKKLRWIPPIMIVLTAISRMYLGVHVPLDLIGGFAIGLGAVCFLHLLPRKIQKILRLGD